MHMSKNKNEQEPISTLRISERATLAACVIAIGAAFALMGVFFTFSWIFFLILIADLTLLVIGRAPDRPKRFTIFISIIGAIMALLFTIASHPWFFQ